MSVYLTGRHPRVIAHRGYAAKVDGTLLDENTLEAFSSALSSGADLIESDIQVTADGVAVLLHDDDLERVAGIKLRISELTFEQVKALRLGRGGEISSLASVLNHFPTARFNLDFKTPESIGPGTKAILEARAEDRVLVASFSDKSRKSAQSMLPNAVGSAGIATVIGIYLAISTGLLGLAKRLARDIVALQIPTRAGFLRFDSKKFILGVHAVGLEVHYWTVNEESEMRRLIALGADGIVTDNTPLARAVLDS